MIKTSAHIIIKEHLNLFKLMIPASIECLKDFADEFVVADNGCTQPIREVLEKSLKDTGKPYKIIDDKGTDFASIRNTTIANTSKDTDYIIHCDSDEFYNIQHLNELKNILGQAKANGVRLPDVLQTWHWWIMIEPTLHQEQFNVKHTIYKYKPELKWKGRVHEWLEGLDYNDKQYSAVEFIHLGYCEPQHEKALSWMHYDLLDPSKGNLNGYREYYDDNSKSVKCYFVDWREPGTILEDRRPICKQFNMSKYPQPVVEHIFKPWKESKLSWTDWLQSIDPESFAFYKEWQSLAKHYGDWRKTFGWLCKKMNWPEEKF